MTEYWLKEFWRLAATLAVGLVIGALTGLGGSAVFIALCCYLVWHALKLRKLAHWLVLRRKPDPQFGNDIWGEIHYQIQRRKARARKRERKLKAVIRLYRESSAAMPDATLVLGSDNAIEWMNDAASILLGLKGDMDIGHRIDNLVRHPDFIGFLHGGDYSESLELASPVDEEKVMEIHIVPYGDDQRLLVARDITKLHRLEAMRRDFIANVSHELSTPLTVISGYLESLGEKPHQASQFDQAVRQMRRQTERMTNLVSDLLQLSRLEINDTREPEAEINVVGMLRGLVTDAGMMDPESRHHITLEADEAVALRGVSRHIYSAFSNVIRNAVQYTPDGGQITVRWSGDEAGACFEVRDTGIGVPASAISRLTERFYRVDAGRSRALGGTGLGLSIVKHVLRNHQARLQIESAADRGSTFRCVFPAERVILHAQPQRSVQ